MRVPMKHKPNADDVRRVALAALASALEDSKQEAKKKPALTGVRAVATGAVLYTAGRAAFTGRRFLRDRLGSNGAQDEEMVDDRDDDDEYEDDEEPEAEEGEDFDDEDYDEEPEAEEDEDFEDEDEDDEPRADEDEDFEEDEEGDEPRAEEDEEFDDEEPEAEEDEDFEDEDEDEERAVASRRPPSHPKRSADDAADAELPSRPSRSRAPVGLS